MGALGTPQIVEKITKKAKNGKKHKREFAQEILKREPTMIIGNLAAHRHSTPGSVMQKRDPLEMSGNLSLQRHSSSSGRMMQKREPAKGGAGKVFRKSESSS
jgi:hypothetical protein